MTKEQRIAENDPQHYSYKGLFCKYSWWKSSDHRVFVITSREEHANGDIYAINLLEMNKEQPICRPYEEIIAIYKKGMFEHTSTMGI